MTSVVLPLLKVAINLPDGEDRNAVIRRVRELMDNGTAVVIDLPSTDALVIDFGQAGRALVQADPVTTPPDEGWSVVFSSLLSISRGS